jgi:hypothetical protein
MKKLFTLVGIVLSANAFAQGWNFQAGVGGHLWNITDMQGVGLTVNLGTTYDFNKVVGARLDFNYDRVGEERIKRIGMQANFHLMPLLSETQTKWGLDLHAGLGWVNNSNAAYNDSYYFRGDDAWNRTIGLTPTMALNEKMMLTFDLTLNNNRKTDSQLKNYTNATIGIRRAF